jgi:ATP-binding cassette, subfamily B, bacterial IrtA/YbtP
MKNKQKQPARKSGIARLLELAGENKGLLVLSGILSVISALLQLAPFVAVYIIVAEMLKNAATPELINYTLIKNWGIYAILFLVGALIFLYAGNMSSHIAAFKTLYNLRVKLSSHLAKLPLGYFNRSSTGAIKKDLELSVEKIESFIAHQVPDLVGAIVLPMAMLAAMFVLDWRLAIASSLPIIIAFGFQFKVYFGKEGRDMWTKWFDSQEKISAEAVEYVRGMPAVKVFGLSVKRFLRFNNSINSYRDLTLGITKTYKKFYSAFFVIVSSILAFILPVAVLLISRQPDNMALALTIIVFLILAPGLSVPVLKLVYLGGTLRQITEGTDRMDNIFDQEPVPEPAKPVQPGKNHSVSFHDVYFSYNSKDNNGNTETLSGISFSAREGQITALVGPSGSGKTTIASLIPRFWDVAAGSIKIGETDIRDISIEKLMDTVSFVFQDAHLFYDTIEENIKMADKTASTEDVIRAAKAASCHDFITLLPQGYQTRIGDGGTYLSGGEAQRISIARAILKNAPILVLDEATAFADPENEVKIQQGLVSLIEGKTVIVIAHRLRTIQEVDHIVVINKGKIEEQGTHYELLAAKGLYGRMWEAHVNASAWELASLEITEGAK